jgi:hypothetical protein
LNWSRPFSAGIAAPTPLPTLVLHHLMSAMRLDRLSFHHTTIDTTVVAKDLDKGTGLLALRNWVMEKDAETIGVGDSKSDLPMFRAATRSFAPAQIDCARQARLLGCKIARHSYQRGLLDIARSVVHPDGVQCARCSQAEKTSHLGQGLFLQLLQAADQTQAANLARALFDPELFSTFVR